MSIADQITRLNNAKAAIKQSLENKGVTVSDSALLDEYPALIGSIPMEGGDPYYEDFYNMRTSNGTNMAGLFAYCIAPELDLRNLDVSNATSMNYMFHYSTASVNIDGWDTSSVTNMEYMFNYFSGSIDVSKLDTSKVISAGYMFCGAKTDKIILTGLSFPKTTSLSYMFYNATGTTLDLSSWDISNITSITGMFNGTNYKKINLSGWNTSNVNNMSQVFYKYNNPLEELIIPDWDMTKCNDNIFYNSSYIPNLKLIDLSRSNDATITKITSFLPTRTADTSGTIKVPGDTSQEVCDALTAKYWIPEKPEEPEVPVDPPAGDIPLYEHGQFRDNSELTEVRTMVTSEHDNLDSMFTGCDNLVSVNTEDWDTSNVYEMYSLFMNCLSLPSLNLSNWVTDKVTRMGWMFMNCQSLTSLDLSSFNTSNVTSMDYMFGSCFALTSIIGLSNFNTSNVTAMNNMFAECNQLQSLDLSGFDTGNVTTMESMFSYMQSYSLPKIDLSSFTTKKLQQAYSMFLWCNNLQELDIRNFELVHEDGTEVAISSMLEGCNELRILRLDNCSNATIRKIINESGMPQEPVYDYSISENVNRKMYCKASEIGDLVAPNGWEFVTVE